MQEYPEYVGILRWYVKNKLEGVDNGREVKVWN